MTTTELAITEYRLRFERSLWPGEATHLRGYFASAFPDQLLLHHHRPGGQLLYAYPLVQFKVIDRTACVLGLAEGGPLVERLWAQVQSARFGQVVLPVLEATVLRRREPLGECADPVEYRFVNPWLGLNQENHAFYEKAGCDAEREEVLERVLIGNCLAVAKAFGHRVQGRLTADARQLRPRVCRFKQRPMLGFDGQFRVNFALPSGIGIGKSVSRGFGTVAALKI